MKVDWRFSAEGDLELGSPKVNDDGQLVYVNSVGEETTEPADRELVRDIPLAVSYMSEKQVIINRLRTENPDWYLHQGIGGDLSELIGMPNTRSTGEHGKKLIENSLCGDGFIKQGDLIVRPIPITSSEILFHLTVKRNTGDLIVPVLYNLEHGLLTEYEVNE